MASQQNDPLTFKSWGENCTSLWESLANGSITQDQFLGSCKPQVDIGVGKVILTILLSILLIGTAGGNILVIIAILIVKKLRSPTNLLIVSLAVTDFMVSILVLPFAIAYQIFEYWPFQQAICDLYSISDLLLCTLSILSLCTISIDRYMAITKPFQYAPKRTPKRMFIMILISWLLSAAISISPIFGWEQQNAPFFCNYNMDLTFQIYATLTAFYIPLTVMLVLYGKILVLAKQMAIADAQIARKCSTDTQTRNSSLPESTDWNRSSISPPGNNCSNSQFYSDLKDNWDGAPGEGKSRQSVVSFRPSPVVMRTNRDPMKSRKVNSMMTFTRRSQSDVVNNGRSSECSGSVGDRNARTIRKRHIQNEDDEDDEDQMSKRKFGTSVEITPGHAVFPSEDKEFETETKFHPPESNSKLQDQQPMMCYIPGIALPGYQLPYPYPFPLPQGYPFHGKRK
ncbi:unnamed protein product [Rodentolepis nana]|uniref:G_PROTEIN_RECEP_F1_2 domain-containing protein n=1 Tax=Rodentolepis nana TaxID=102285 RepID=A0A0R3TXG2_RODNA|nr:unnamed protein product [Rodentolepis nana]